VHHPHSSITVLQPALDRSRLGGLGFIAHCVAAEPHGAGGSAAAPFPHQRPFAEQRRRDVDDVEPVDVSGRVGAGQEGHRCPLALGQFCPPPLNSTRRRRGSTRAGEHERLTSPDPNPLYPLPTRGFVQHAPARRLVVLQGEEIAHVAIEPLGPEMRVGLGIDQLGVDAKLVAGPADAAFQDVAHTQLAADLLCIDSLVPIGERGIARDHEHVREPREIGRQILGHPVGEILLLRIVAEIGERQHDDRQPRCAGGLGDRRSGRREIWVRDGAMWSSAGISAGVDLTLALIEKDQGVSVALQVARELVVFLKRPGGQSQFSTVLSGQISDADGPLGPLFAWIADHLDADLRAEVLAEKAGMSLRTFARTFVTRTGLTPAKAVEMVRIQAAREAIEQSDTPLGVIAARCGFGGEQRMRRAFLRQFNATPADIRARFSLMTAGSE
jgi:AraC-like DNA-binding protein